MDNYLNIKINQIRAAKERGMDVSEEEELYENMSIKDFERYVDYNRSPYTFKNKLNSEYSELNPIKGEQVKTLKVFYINKSEIKTISSATIKEIITEINSNISKFPKKKYSTIIIGQVPLSTASKEIIHTYPDLDITYFEEINLGYFAMDSDLSPEYYVLSDDEKAEVIKYYKIKNERVDFPWILTDEQIVMVSGWKPGTLIRVVRNDPEISIVDKTFNYRLVVQSSNFK